MDFSNHNVRLERYARLLAPGTRLALHDWSGCVLYTERWPHLPAGLIDAGDTAGATHRVEDGAALWLSRCMHIGAEQRPLWVIAWIPCRKCDDFEQQSNAAFAAVVENVREDIEQDEALTNLAAELAVRYEELNLFYGMDERYHNNANQDALKYIEQLVASCVDFLPIDYVCLYVPEYDLTILKPGSAGSSEAFEVVIAEAHRELVNLMELRCESVVINHDSAYDCAILNTDLPMKVVLTPVKRARREVIGYLAFFKGREQAHFTNSDRRLSEVVASDVAKALLAQYDPVTGLLNRINFERMAIRAMDDRPSDPVALVEVDIDQFKLINDTCGNAAGDRLLRQIGMVLKTCVPHGSLVTRLGNDEFAAFVSPCTPADAGQLAEEVRRAIKHVKFVNRERRFDLSASLGVAAAAAGKPIDELLGEAEIACSLVKEFGGNGLREYQASDKVLIDRQRQLEWAGRLKSGAANNRFVLFGQAITSLHDVHGSPRHFEILLRLRDEDGALVPPGIFIPAAERYGFMHELDRWVLMSTLELFEEFRRDHGCKVGCSVNLSGATLCDDAFRAFAATAIRTSSLPPESICFEITETVAIGNLGQALLFMDELRELGCTFALDDFGAGMSSYAYLRKLPVDYVKIDGGFVKSVVDDPVNYVMIESIHNIARTMGIQTVAEFVEDEPTIAMLQRIGVDFGQGYGIDRPGPMRDKLAAMVASPPAKVREAAQAG